MCFPKTDAVFLVASVCLTRPFPGFDLTIDNFPCLLNARGPIEPLRLFPSNNAINLNFNYNKLWDVPGMMYALGVDYYFHCIIKAINNTPIMRI